MHPGAVVYNSPSFHSFKWRALKFSGLYRFMSIARDKFDFEVGQLVKSPCVDCKTKDKFPSCSDQCKLLDQIRTRLAKGVSSTYSSFDPTPSS